MSIELVMPSKNLIVCCPLPLLPSIFLWKSKSYSVMSNSLWPHGLYPSSLLCLWDSPGKNSGVGCHSLLQGSSQLWDRTWVSCTAGRFFAVWATRDVHRTSRLVQGLRAHAPNAGGTGSIPDQGTRAPAALKLPHHVPQQRPSTANKSRNWKISSGKTTPRQVDRRLPGSPALATAPVPASSTWRLFPTFSQDCFQQDPLSGQKSI